MDEGEPFDDAFVAAAPVRESELRAVPLPKPSRESLREVKREARQRSKARRPRGGGKVRGVAVVAVVAALGGGGVWYAGSHGMPRATPGPRELRGTGAGAPVVVPSYTPPPAKPADPFSGTSVASWPVGAAGIKAPAAGAVGPYAKAQVADAYARTARYLRAAMLDRAVLWTGDLAPVHATLSPASVRAQAREDDAAYLANRFPSSVRPSSQSVRVNGEMTAKPGERGTLWVEFAYVATYAVRPAGGGETQLVAIRREGTLEYRAAGAARVTAPWVYLTTYVSDHSSGCEGKNPAPGYLDVRLGDARRQAKPPPRGSYPPVNMLDPRATFPPGEGCFTNTGKFRP